MLRVDPELTLLRLGARDTFASLATTNSVNRYFLTQHQDESGNITTFTYTNDNGVACLRVIDLNRATNRITYSSVGVGGFRCVSQVTDRYNRTATLELMQTCFLLRRLLS